MNHFSVHLKLTQYCKLTILQFFKMVLKKKSKQWLKRLHATNWHSPQLSHFKITIAFQVIYITKNLCFFKFYIFINSLRAIPVLFRIHAELCSNFLVVSPLFRKQDRSIFKVKYSLFSVFLWSSISLKLLRHLSYTLQISLHLSKFSSHLSPAKVANWS